MKLTDPVIIPSQVMAREVGGEIVILDLASGTYYGLDAVGARFWQLVGAGHTPAQACEALLDEFDVSREILEADVLRLLLELNKKGLVSPA